MIALFPKCKGYFVAGEAVLFMICAALFKEALPWYLSVGVFFVGSMILYIIVGSLAVRTHTALLGILYTQLDPKEFIRLYSPLTDTNGLRANVRFSVKAYLSNGYAAAGDFKKALAILDNMPCVPEKIRGKSETLIAVNKCSIYIYLENIHEAKQQYAKIPDTAPEKEILRVRIACMENKCGEKDQDVIRASMKAGGSKLHNLEQRFTMGCLCTALGQTDFSNAYFSEISKANRQLYISRKAAELLKRQ